MAKYVCFQIYILYKGIIALKWQFAKLNNKASFLYIGMEGGMEMLLNLCVWLVLLISTADSQSE